MWFFFDPRFWFIVGPFLALAAWCSARVKTTFRRFQNVPVRSGMTGAQAAAAVARAGGAEVNIERVGGFLSDHYDPRTRTLRLSPDVYDGRSISSIAVAAHEAGHAIQHAHNYAFLNFRSMMVPAATIGSQAWLPMFFIGMMINATGLSLLGVAVFAITVLFQLVTLPVEFDASNRAKAVLANTGIVATEEESAGVKKVLGAAAMTYVAGALVAVAHLLYYLTLLTGHDD
jgi:Zn-dependent membrane protease YugP